jgi:hypothetical protein
MLEGMELVREGMELVREGMELVREGMELVREGMELVREGTALARLSIVSRRWRSAIGTSATRSRPCLARVIRRLP